MNKGDLLFVYGTLMKGERADMTVGHSSLAVTFIGEDRLNGELYDMGYYPGAKIEADLFDPARPTIEGEVYRIRNQNLCAQLDAYEGFPNLFSRRQVPTEKGRIVWVYTYNLATKPVQLIAAGSWRHRQA